MVGGGGGVSRVVNPDNMFSLFPLPAVWGQYRGHSLYPHKVTTPKKVSINPREG